VCICVYWVFAVVSGTLLVDPPFLPQRLATTSCAMQWKRWLSYSDSHGHVTSLGTRWSTMIALGTSWCSQTCGAALGLCETQLVRPKTFFSKMFWEPRSPWWQVLDLFMVFGSQWCDKNTVNQDGPRHRTLWAVVDGCGLWPCQSYPSLMIMKGAWNTTS